MDNETRESLDRLGHALGLSEEQITESRLQALIYKQERDQRQLIELEEMRQTKTYKCCRILLCRWV